MLHVIILMLLLFIFFFFFFCPECQMLLFNFLFKLIIIACLNLYISRVMFAVTYYSIDMNSIYSSKVYFV